MTEVLSVTRKLQLGTAVTAGTNLPATRAMQTLLYVPDIKETAEVFVPSGQFLETVPVLSQQWTEGSLTGKPSYGEIVYALSALLGPASIATPGGGTLARTWTWNIYGNVAIVPQTFTAEDGDSTEAEVVDFWHLVGLTIAFNRQQIALTGKTMAQKSNLAGSMTSLSAVNAIQTLTMTGSPTGGTFTLSFLGQTTSAIAYNASAATVQAALQALSTIGSGNVTCAGGALPGTPITATFGGTLGNQPITLMTAASGSLTGGSTPTMTPTTTTPGVSITPEPTAVPLVPNQVNVYVDASSGNFGVTQFLRDFDATLDFQDTQDQVWTLNSSNGSFAAIAPKVPKPMVKLSVAQDSQGIGLITALRAGTRQYVRLSSTGGIIEGAIHYGVVVDMAVDVISPGTAKAVNGIHCREMTCQLAHDASWGQALRIVVTNRVTGLA